MVFSKLAQGYLQQIFVKRLALKKRVYLGYGLPDKGRTQFQRVLSLVLGLDSDAAQITDCRSAAKKGFARQGKDSKLCAKNTLPPKRR